MKKILASSLVLTLALTPISTLALSKEETNGIYLTTTDVIDILNWRDMYGS